MCITLCSYEIIILKNVGLTDGGPSPADHTDLPLQPPATGTPRNPQATLTRKQVGSLELFPSPSISPSPFPSLIHSSAADHLQWPFLTFCPHSQEASRSWWKTILSSLLWTPPNPFSPSTFVCQLPIPRSTVATAVRIPEESPTKQHTVTTLSQESGRKQNQGTKTPNKDKTRNQHLNSVFPNPDAQTSA